MVREFDGWFYEAEHLRGSSDMVGVRNYAWALATIRDSARVSTTGTSRVTRPP